MILFDMRYFALRGKLRNIMRDTRDNIPSLTDLVKKLEKTPENQEQELFKKYIQQFDYKRARDFNNALRKLRQENFYCHNLGFTIAPNRCKTLIEQADYFADAMIEKIKEEKRLT